MELNLKINDSDDEEELPDEHFKCDRCKAVKHCDEYVSLDNDTSGNTICEECIKPYIKENGLEESDKEEDEEEDEEEEEE